MRFISLIFYILIISLGVVFACLNAESVKVDYYIGFRQMPLSALSIGLFAIGSCIGLSAGFISTIKLKFENKKLKKNLELVKKEVSQLRLLSVKD